MDTVKIRNILYKIIRTYNLLLAIIPSIAFYRATVQPDYKWGLLVIEGKGMSSDYWFLISFMLLAWASFILEIWYKRKWYYIFPLLLSAIVAGVMLYGSLSDNEMVFQGDVWKFKFELSFVFVALSFILFVLTVLWSFIDKSKFISSNLFLRGGDIFKLIAGLSLSIVIFVLFAQGMGGVHSILDGIAVGLTVIQALFIASIIDKTGTQSNSSVDCPNR